VLVIKQVRCLQRCLLEVGASGLLAPEAGSIMSGGSTPGSSGSGGGGTYDPDAVPSAASRAAASGFLAAVLEALPGYAAVTTQTVQEEAAR